MTIRWFLLFVAKLAFFSSFSLVPFTSACTETKRNEIEEACGSEDIREIRKVDNISKGCRQALSSFLPNPDGNIKDRLFGFAQDGSGLYLAGLNSEGKAIEFATLNALTVKATLNGVEQELPASAYSVEAVSALNGDVLSLSLLSDYSASMQDEDVAEVSSLFTDLAANVGAISEIEHILFSTVTQQQLDFSGDATAIEAALAKDEDFERASTALFDGMGLGLSHLAESQRPGRIIVVGTDGMENASVSSTKESILQAIAAQSNLLVVFMATNYADLDLIKELIGSRGFYVYTRTLSEARALLLEFSKALREGMKITLHSPYDTADSVTVEHAESGLSASYEL